MQKFYDLLTESKTEINESSEYIIFDEEDDMYAVADAVYKKLGPSAAIIDDDMGWLSYDSKDEKKILQIIKKMRIKPGYISSGAKV
jgi:hypothetical protein